LFSARSASYADTWLRPQARRGRHLLRLVREPDGGAGDLLGGVPALTFYASHTWRLLTSYASRTWRLL
jgi:hypothetical protein